MRAFRPMMLDFALRGLLLLALLTAFHLLDWESVIRSTVYSCGLGLSAFCQVDLLPGGLGIICDGQSFSFNKECTYLDLFLTAAPFVWRAQQRFTANLARLMFVLYLIWSLNAARVVAGLFASVHGASWRLCHDLPDMLLYWPFLAVAVLLYGDHVFRVYPRRQPACSTASP